MYRQSNKTVISVNVKVIKAHVSLEYTHKNKICKPYRQSIKLKHTTSQMCFFLLIYQPLAMSFIDLKDQCQG